jgi:RNA polymerase sigma-70 factor (ECF subfamily)
MDSSDRVWRERCLLRAVLAGDEQAWEALYTDAFDALHAYVNWRCAGLRDLVDDVVQETWLTAVRRIRAFEPERGSFAGWLRGIAANIIRNQLRRHDRRNGQANAHLLWHGLPTVPRSGDRGTTGCVASPADADAAKREQAQQVARALASLPDHYEAVLRAKYLDQQSVADIAAEQGATAKAVESMLTRARQAFREAYSKRE